MGRGVSFRISPSSALAGRGSWNVSITKTPSSPITKPALPPASPSSFTMAAHTPSPIFCKRKSGAAPGNDHAMKASRTTKKSFRTILPSYHGGYLNCANSAKLNRYGLEDPGGEGDPVKFSGREYRADARD